MKDKPHYEACVYAINGYKFMVRDTFIFMTEKVAMACLLSKDGELSVLRHGKPELIEKWVDKQRKEVEEIKLEANLTNDRKSWEEANEICYRIFEFSNIDPEELNMFIHLPGYLDAIVTRIENPPEHKPSSAISDG